MDKKFVYLVKHSRELKSLAQFECELSFGSKQPDMAKLQFHPSLVDISRSGFIMYGAEVIAQAESIEKIAEAIPQGSITITEGIVESARTSAGVKIYRQDLFPILEKILGSFNLNEPQERYLLCNDGETWVFARIHSSNDRKWHLHKEKPMTLSSALHSKVSRCAVYGLSLGGGKSFHDGCCGTGSLLLDAADHGFSCSGTELHYSSMRMCRKNVEHFGVDAELHLMNFLNWERPSDMMVIDFPYGVSCNRNEEEEKALFAHACKLTKNSLVTISGADLSALIPDGFREVYKTSVKYPTLTRHFLLLRR